MGAGHSHSSAHYGNKDAVALGLAALVEIVASAMSVFAMHKHALVGSSIDAENDHSHDHEQDHAD